MTSLADVYEDNVGEVESVRRLYAGTGLFVAGVVLTVVAVVVGGTNVLAGLGVGFYESRQLAGVLGGVGIPAVLMGVFTVLPASQRVRGAAAIGGSVCVLGVALFWHAYPDYWVGSPAAQDLTLVVAAVYVFGAFTTIWTLFTAIVNFKTRNDPGGTVEVRLTHEGETRVVEVDAETAERVRDGEAVDPEAFGGGVGMLGSQPDGDVQTQTASPSASQSASRSQSSRSTSASRSSSASQSASTPSQSSSRAGSSTGRSSSPAGSSNAGSASTGSAAASDGGSTTQDISSPMDDHAGDGHDAEFLDDEPEDSPSVADRYCGNCEHFDYVQTNQGIQPHCGYHDETMDDMEACDAWEPNN